MIGRISYLFLAVLLLLLNGCTLEQKLARSFVKEEKPGQFFLLRPSFVLKYNLKEFELTGIDSLDAITKDSVLIENSLFLKWISDSLLIEEYIISLKRGLESYGADVLTEDAVDTLMANGGTPYVVNIAQISLEEYIHPYSSEEEVYDGTIVIDGIDLNAINYNIWIELGRMNTDKSNKVLFTSDFLLDNVQGTLKQHLLTGEMSFDYTIDTITMPRAYEFARQMGYVSAGYLFDYLMNNYIWEKLPENYPYERYYYHYDPVRRLIYAIDSKQSFIELDDQ